MEEIIYTVDDLLLAQKKANELGVLNKSITKGSGNLASQLGEIMVANYLDAEYGKATYEYDLIFKDLKIDVKTKNCTSTPREHYLVTVADVTKKQNCDIYVFARVLQPAYNKGWLVGWMPQIEFFDGAKFFKKGDIDPTGNGIWKFTADCYNLPIRELYGMDSLKSYTVYK